MDPRDLYVGWNRTTVFRTLSEQSNRKSARKSHWMRNQATDREERHTELYFNEKSISYSYVCAGFVVVPLSCGSTESDTTSDTFCYRAMLCIRGTSHGPASVCLCLCLSVTSRCSTKTAKRRITQTTPHDTPGTLVFWCQRSPRNSTGVTPYESVERRWGGQNRRLSTNNRLYLENGKR